METLFSQRANGETFVKETECFWKKSETFFFVSRKQKMFPQEVCAALGTEKTSVQNSKIINALYNNRYLAHSSGIFYY